jgi:hypothetical protein
MTETTNLAGLRVGRQLALTEAMLLLAALRELAQRRPAPHRRSRRLLLTLGIAVSLIAAAGKPPAASPRASVIC